MGPSGPWQPDVGKGAWEAGPLLRAQEALEASTEMGNSGSAGVWRRHTGPAATTQVDGPRQAPKSPGTRPHYSLLNLPEEFLHLEPGARASWLMVPNASATINRATAHSPEKFEVLG